MCQFGLLPLKTVANTPTNAAGALCSLSPISDISIRVIKGMTVKTVSLPCMVGSTAVAPKDILTHGHQFEVLDFDARPVTAEMIQR